MARSLLLLWTEHVIATPAACSRAALWPLSGARRFCPPKKSYVLSPGAGVALDAPRGPANNQSGGWTVGRWDRPTRRGDPRVARAVEPSRYGQVSRRRKDLQHLVRIANTTIEPSMEERSHHRSKHTVRIRGSRIPARSRECPVARKRNSR